LDSLSTPFSKDASTGTQSIVLPGHGKHIPALDGIRGAAILLVLFHHLANSLKNEFGYRNVLQGVASSGWIGVDLFFVLSGFLITGILYDSKASKSYFKNFYMRRVLRIFPLYYGTLLLALLLRVVLPDLNSHGTENPSWLWIYATNIVLAWKGAGAFGALDHFWSLAIEEQFYFVWPLAVFLLNRNRLMQLSLFLFFLSFGLRIALLLGGTPPASIYFLTFTRLDTLSIGAFLALAIRSSGGVRNLVKPAWLVGLASGLGIAAIMIIRNIPDELDFVMQAFGYSLLALFFGAMLILTITSPLQRVFNLGMLRWFGKYSYGLYMWHPFIFILLLHTNPARTIRGDSGAVGAIVSVGLALGATFAVTLLSWHCWEKQFLKLKQYFK